MDLMKRLRMLIRVGVESVLGIYHSGWLNVFIITTLMLMLLSFGVVLGFSLTLKKFAGQLGARNEFSVHVVHNADVKAFDGAISSISKVKKYKLITNKEIFRDTKATWGVDLDESFNDMPNTFNITVSDPADILPIIERLLQYNARAIESIEYAPTLIKRIHSVKNILIFGGTLFSLILATTTFIIIFNTIELVIRARKDELKLLNFMGVPDWFIKGPFVMQGLIYAIAGSLLSVIGLGILSTIIKKSLGDSANLLTILLPSTWEFTAIVFVLTLTAVIFSIASSIWATERRLEQY